MEYITSAATQRADTRETSDTRTVEGVVAGAGRRPRRAAAVRSRASAAPAARRRRQRCHEVGRRGARSARHEDRRRGLHPFRQNAGADRGDPRTALVPWAGGPRQPRRPVPGPPHSGQGPRGTVPAAAGAARGGGTGVPAGRTTPKRADWGPGTAGVSLPMEAQVNGLAALPIRPGDRRRGAGGARRGALPQAGRRCGVRAARGGVHRVADLRALPLLTAAEVDTPSCTPPARRGRICGPHCTPAARRTCAGRRRQDDLRDGGAERPGRAPAHRGRTTSRRWSTTSRCGDWAAPVCSTRTSSG